MSYDKDLLRISRDVATELSRIDGQRWYPVSDQERRRSWYHPIKNAIGEELHFENPRGRSGRVLVSGSIPHPSAQHAYREDERPSRTFARQRPADVIAREILRDILPGYRRSCAACIERYRRHIEDTTTRETNAAGLAAIIGEQVYGHDANRFSHYFDPIRPGGDRVYIAGELRTPTSAHLQLDLPAELAADLLRLIMAYQTQA